jgi:short subunit dehydrogenase-like uncharacterized protein
MPGPIAVYGATGYTGRLVVREATRQGLDIVLSGRSSERLHALAQEIGVDARVRAAALDDRDALRRAFRDCAAVINCAGPFSRYGEPVVRAAIETGTNYLDTTGEQTYMQRVYERHQDAARAAEVAVVTAMGFDYVPGDMTCRLAARDHEPLEELVVAYAVRGFAPTRGTTRSALEIMKGGDLAYEDGRWRPAGAGPLRAAFRFPEPFGRQAVTKYPGGEVVTVPRHTRTRKVTQLIAAAALAPVPQLAPAMPVMAPPLGLALRTPLKALVDLAVDRLPEGPSAEQRARSEFCVVAVARGEDGRVGRGVVRGRDVYNLTAVIAVHGATLMAADGFEKTGVLPSAGAFEPVEFLDYLGDHAVAYELDRAGEPAGASPSA